MHFCPKMKLISNVKTYLKISFCSIIFWLNCFCFLKYPSLLPQCYVGTVGSQLQVISNSSVVSDVEFYHLLETENCDNLVGIKKGIGLFLSGQK